MRRGFFFRFYNTGTKIRATALCFFGILANLPPSALYYCRWLKCCEKKKVTVHGIKSRKNHPPRQVNSGTDDTCDSPRLTDTGRGDFYAATIGAEERGMLRSKCERRPRSPRSKGGRYASRRMPATFLFEIGIKAKNLHARRP